MASDQWKKTLYIKIGRTVIQLLWDNSPAFKLPSYFLQHKNSFFLNIMQEKN